MANERSRHMALLETDFQHDVKWLKKILIYLFMAKHFLHVGRSLSPVPFGVSLPVCVQKELCPFPRPPGVRARDK